MKIQHHLSIFLLTLSFSIFSANSQSTKFGKIDKVNLKETVCPIDSNAHAYFIFDIGNSYFYYAGTQVSSNSIKGSDKGFQIKFSRHFRIKFLDNSALDEYANIEIPYYKNGRDEEIIGQVKAVSFNLENNKIVKTKLKNKEIIREEKNANWNILKFAIPNVKAGSVIDVSYSITSDFLFNLREWQFEHLIPTVSSSYHVSIPEYFNYNVTQKGYYPVQTEHSSRSATINITYSQEAQGMTVKEKKYTQSFDLIENITNYTAENIPAFKVEKFLKTPENYLSKIEFELASTRYPNSTIKNYTTSWEKITETLLESSYFGKELKNAPYLRSDLTTNFSNRKPDQALMNDIFSFMKKKMKWNQITTKYANTNLRSAYKNGTGNSADINLNLLMMLREAGFESYPVVLSTTSHGLIFPVHPSISSFNYVVAMVKLDGKYYLLDATDPYTAPNILPERCLNGKGRIIDEKVNDWISLLQGNSAAYQSKCNLTLIDNLTLKGDFNNEYFDFAAEEKRNEVAKYSEPDKYFESLNKNLDGAELSNSEVINLDSLGKSFTLKGEIALKDRLTVAGDMIYFSPIVFHRMDENPFKLEKREYPVEFSSPISGMKTVQITLPENYKVEELPKPVAFVLPDKSARFTFSAIQYGNIITFTSIFQIQKDLYLPVEYANLKEFYNMVVNKEQEQVILKKKETSDL